MPVAGRFVTVGADSVSVVKLLDGAAHAPPVMFVAVAVKYYVVFVSNPVTIAAKLLD